MQLTAENMQAATGCARGVALTWAKPLGEACAQYEIDTPARLSAFLAQVGHESAGFTRTVESFAYRAERLVQVWPTRFTLETAQRMVGHPDAIAEAVYGGRMGNNRPGDGYKFRGRGLVMATGRANYAAICELLRERAADVPDLLAQPEALAEPRWAALSAAAFWEDHDLNRLADTGDFRGITKRINGGLIGWDDRVERYARAKAALA